MIFGPRKLFHFTCDHGLRGLGRTGRVRPRLQPFVNLTLAWFTDLPDPEPEEVGLTSSTLSCNRLEYRYTVDDETDIVPWLDVVRTVPVDPAFWSTFHLPPAQPDHWFVSFVPVPVRLS